MHGFVHARVVGVHMKFVVQWLNEEYVHSEGPKYGLEREEGDLPEV